MSAPATPAAAPGSAMPVRVLAVQGLSLLGWLLLGLSPWLAVPVVVCAFAWGAARRAGHPAAEAVPVTLAVVWGGALAATVTRWSAVTDGPSVALAIAAAQAAMLAAGVSRRGVRPMIVAGSLLPPALAAALQGRWAWGLCALGLGLVLVWRRQDPAAAPSPPFGASVPGMPAGVPASPPAASSPAAMPREPDPAAPAHWEAEANAARERAEQALGAARQAVRDKTRFLAAASHDLRQPVHAIGLFVGALKEEIRDGRGRYLVERLERSMAGLDELFNRLLDISRIDAGTIEPKLSAFAIVPLLQTLESRFAPMAASRHLRLRVHLPPPCTVRSDPALLTEILMNLLSNAFRYTERGGILVGTRRRGDRLWIQVWDTGLGIPPEQTGKIFDEFVQLGNSARDRRQGLGLGLAIVRRLAESLGSSVAVRSRPGRGSVFEVSVPLSADRPASPTPEPLDGDTAALQGLLVLVVDDELDILVAMEALLVSWGCFVIVARSVAEARRHLDTTERFPDVLITDHRLGEDTSSRDVVATVTELVPVPVPVIVVSGDAGPTLEALVRDRGWSLLPKPVNPQRLRRLVVELTRQG